MVFEEGDRFWLAEGFHRLGAYTAAGITEVPCDVRQGGLRDAILHSAGANSDHGVRRSNADKRRAVMMLLRDEEWGQWTANEVARRCAVSPTFVGTLRHSLSTVDSDPGTRTYRDRHGNVSQMNTARIGRQAAAPADPPAEPTETAVTAVLADALARQYRWEAEQVRGPSAPDGGASNVVPLRRPKQPAHTSPGRSGYIDYG